MSKKKKKQDGLSVEKAIGFLKKSNDNKRSNKINRRKAGKDNSVKVKTGAMVTLSTGKNLKVIKKTRWYVYLEDGSVFNHNGINVDNDKIRLAFTENKKI